MKKVEVRKIIRDMVEIYEKISTVYDYHFKLGGELMVIEITGVMPCEEDHRRTSFKYLTWMLGLMDSSLCRITDKVSSKEFDNIISLLDDVDRIDCIEFHKRVDKYKRGETKRNVLRLRKLIDSCM